MFSSAADDLSATPSASLQPLDLLFRRGLSDKGASSRPLLSNRKNAVATAMILFVPASPKDNSPPTRTLLAPWGSVSLQTTHTKSSRCSSACVGGGHIRRDSSPGCHRAPGALSTLSPHPPGSAPSPPQAEAPAHRCAPCTKGSDSLNLPSAPPTLLLAFRMRSAECVETQSRSPSKRHLCDASERLGALRLL